jgi:hypothetical protein
VASCVTGDSVKIGFFGEISDFVSGGIDGILSKIAAAIMNAAVDLFSSVGDVPTLAGKNGMSENDPALKINADIHAQTNWLVITLAVVSLLFAAGRMAIERRGQAGITALQGLVRVILTVGAAWSVVFWLAQEADSYSKHLYEQGIKAQLKLIATCGTDGLTAFLLIIVGLLLLIAGCVHIILMYVRLGVMTLMMGTLPMAAAASMTDTGSGWWRKHIAWMTSWLLYKPTVGLIMYGGGAMIGASGTNDAKQFKLAGVGILLMSGIALPALMRLIVPAMASLGKSDGTGSAGGAAASGAKTVAGAAGAAGAMLGGKKSGGGGSAGGGAKASGAGGGGGGAGGGRAPSRSGLHVRAGAAAAARGAGKVAKLGEQAGKVAGSAHKHATNITKGWDGD